MMDASGATQASVSGPSIVRHTGWAQTTEFLISRRAATNMLFILDSANMKI